MRIIVGHDFYDNGMAFGQDPSVVFVREKNRRMSVADAKAYGLNVREWKPALEVRDDTLRNGNSRMSSLRNPHHFLLHRGVSYWVSIMLVVLAGQLYRGVAIEVQASTFGSQTPRDSKFSDGATHLFCFWNAKSIEAWSESHGLAFYARGPGGAFRNDELFSPTSFSRDVVPRLVRDRITIMTYSSVQQRQSSAILRQFSPDDLNEAWRVNGDDLSEFQFWKAVDAFQTFQMISMWVGGVLPRQGNPAVEIVDDQVKIHKAGFDLKTSFRRPKKMVG